MTPSVAGMADRSRHPRLPAVVVGAVLGAAVVLLVCVSGLVESPASSTSVPGFGAAVTPTTLTGDHPSTG